VQITKEKVKNLLSIKKKDKMDEYRALKDEEELAGIEKGTYLLSVRNKNGAESLLLTTVDRFGAYRPWTVNLQNRRSIF